LPPWRGMQLHGATFLDTAACRSEIGKDACFAIVTPARTLYAVADSPADADEWLRILRIVVRAAASRAAAAAPGGEDGDEAAASGSAPADPATADPSAAQPAADAAVRAKPSGPGAGAGPGEPPLPTAARDLTAKFSRLRDSGTREHARLVERLKNRVKALLPGPPPGLCGRSRGRVGRHSRGLEFFVAPAPLSHTHTHCMRPCTFFLSIAFCVIPADSRPWKSLSKVWCRGRKMAHQPSAHSATKRMH
jgi:hypothetical protein